MNYSARNEITTEFIRSHINKEDCIYLLKDNTRNTIEVLEEYLIKLYDNPYNICVKYESEKSGYSKIKNNNKWDYIHNSILYPKLISDLVNSYNKLKKDGKKFNITQRIIDNEEIKLKKRLFITTLRNCIFKKTQEFKN